MPAGRPQLYPIKKLIRFDQDMLDAVDDWRRRQTPIPAVTDAIRTLVTLGLTAQVRGSFAKPASAPKPAVGAKAASREKARQGRS